MSIYASCVRSGGLQDLIQREAGSYSATARTCGSFPALLEGRLRAQHSVLHLTPYDILVPQFLLTRRPPASSLHRWRCRKCRVVGGSPPEKKKKTPSCFTTCHRVVGPAVKIQFVRFLVLCVCKFSILLHHRRTQSCINLQSESARADALLAQSDV